MQVANPAAEVAVNEQCHEPNTTEQLKQNVQFAEIAPEEIEHLDWAATPYDPSYEETIRTYLQRPVPIATLIWSEETGTNGVLLDAPNLVSTWLDAYPFILQKLRGFKYLRGDMEIQIRVNGNRFQYGQAIAAFLPLYGDVRYGISWANRDSVYCSTMCPSVAIMPFMDNIATLRIPFAYPEYFLNLTSFNPSEQGTEDVTPDSLGRLQIRVLNPMGSIDATVTSVGMTVYCRMINPVVTGFTNFVAGTRGPLSSLQEQGLEGLVNKVSGMLRSTRGSAPIVHSSIATVRVNPGGLDLCRTDGADTSILGGYHGQNATRAIVDQVGHRADMDFDKIFAKPNLLRVFTWTPSNNTNDVLATFGVGPHQAVSTLPGDGVDSPVWSPVATEYRTYLTHLAESFQYWRGTLRYRLQVIASGFHSGRLMITWTPEWMATSTPDQGVPEVAGNHQRYILILDLQQQTDIFFEVPYVQSRPWLLTNYRTDVDNASNELPAYNGIIQVRVLNRLCDSGPHVLAIQANMWQYGSSDLEFALPIARTPPSLFANAIDAPSVALPAPGDNYGVPPQDTPTDAVLQEQCIELPVGDTRAQPLCRSRAPLLNVAMGEKIRSVYDLLRRPSPLREQWGSVNSVFNALYTRDSDDPSGTLSRKVYCGSFIRYFQDMYLGNRGSIRYAFFCPVSQHSRLLMTVKTLSVNDGLVPQYYGAYTGEVAQVNNSAHTSELTVPYYSPLLFIPTKGMRGVGNNINGSSAVQDSWGVVAVDTRARNYHYRVLFASVGADYDMFYLIPPQPVGTAPANFAPPVATNTLSYYTPTATGTVDGPELAYFTPTV